MILDLIAKHESRGNYNIMYGGRTERLTEMTVSEVLNLQRITVNNGGQSASGKYQIIRKTLQGLVKEMGLSGKELFNEDMQDRMAIHLLNRRGFQKFLDGQINIEDMILRLSKEWASFPRDKSNKSYYAGDGLNKALVSYEEVRNALDWERTNRMSQKKKIKKLFAPFSFVRRFFYGDLNV